MDEMTLVATSMRRHSYRNIVHF